MQDLEQKTFQKRYVAYKVRISDILNRSFAKDELSSVYIKLNDKNVSRVNIIATLVFKPEHDSTYTNALIDDGTGRISLRTFGNVDIFSKVDVGDVVLMIGKIREFNNEKYITPEILKKINNFEWFNVRKLELDNNNSIESSEIKNEAKGQIGDITSGINESIYYLIKRLDDGNGVFIEDIIKNSNNKNAENMIKDLLEKGDVFEIKPGKLKVLE